MTVATKSDTETRSDSKSGYFPPYKVLIHNDDVTPMDFVIFVLQTFFSKPLEHAFVIMKEAHVKNIALVGVYPREQAEFRVDQSHSAAQTHKFPLKLSIEADE